MSSLTRTIIMIAIFTLSLTLSLSHMIQNKQKGMPKMSSGKTKVITKKKTIYVNYIYNYIPTKTVLFSLIYLMFVSNDETCANVQKWEKQQQKMTLLPNIFACLANFAPLCCTCVNICICLRGKEVFRVLGPNNIKEKQKKKTELK